MGSRFIEHQHFRLLCHCTGDQSFTLFTSGQFAVKLVRQGFRGPVYCTAPTRDLSSLLLIDYSGYVFVWSARRGQPS
jgi:hypothetical protein